MSSTATETEIEYTSLLGPTVRIGKHTTLTLPLGLLEELNCPITKERLAEPVTIDGDPTEQPYSRAAIIEWLRENSTYPTSGTEITQRQIRLKPASEVTTLLLLSEVDDGDWLVHLPFLHSDFVAGIVQAATAGWPQQRVRIYYTERTDLFGKKKFDLYTKPLHDLPHYTLIPDEFATKELLGPSEKDATSQQLFDPIIGVRREHVTEDELLNNCYTLYSYPTESVGFRKKVGFPDTPLNLVHLFVGERWNRLREELEGQPPGLPVNKTGIYSLILKRYFNVPKAEPEADSAEVGIPLVLTERFLAKMASYKIGGHLILPPGGMPVYTGRRCNETWSMKKFTGQTITMMVDASYVYGTHFKDCTFTSKSSESSDELLFKDSIFVDCTFENCRFKDFHFCSSSHIYSCKFTDCRVEEIICSDNSYFKECVNGGGSTVTRVTYG